MTDLETRLRADAERTVAPPDFDAALRTATEPVSRTHRWPAVAAAALVLGAAGTFVALRSGSDHAPAGSAGSDTPSIAGAITAPYSEAPRQLMLFIDGVSDARDGQCADVQVHLVETATQVTASLSVRWRPEQPIKTLTVRGPNGSPVPHRTDPQPGCRTGEQTLVTGLDAPLGSRTLIDAATGQALDVYEGPVPTPGYVPADYTPWGHDHSDPMSSATLDDRAGALGPLTLSWGARTSVGERLEVVAAPSDHVNPGADVIDHVTVDDRDATVTQTAQTRCVTWTPSSGGGLQVCSDLETAGAGAQLLSEDELVRVADSLQP
jgi:hypothetical protein